MKLTKLERSNKAHYNLRYKAEKKFYDPASTTPELMIAEKKYSYHNEVYNLQKTLKRILNKDERIKIWFKWNRK